jgi:mono/diheme cytochrome c family protein
MTNAQKWVAGFLVLFVLLLALSKLTDREPSKADYYESEEVTTTENVSTEIDVEKIIANNKCYVCHGRDLAGSGMGPSLAEVGKNWEKEGLANYLKNPNVFVSNARLEALKDKYNREMPALESLSQAELNALADYLMKK